MEIECPYCGTAHLLDLGGNRPAVLIKMHCLMCGGRLRLPLQAPSGQQQPYYPPDDGGYPGYPGISGSLPITLHAIRPRDADRWHVTGSLYDERLGTWVPNTGSAGREMPSTLRAIVRRSIGLSEGVQEAGWHGVNRIAEED